jgi:hypothetical protein
MQGYTMTFEEYEYTAVAQLRAVGDRGALLAVLEELGVTEDDANRIADVTLADEHGLLRLD